MSVGEGATVHWLVSDKSISGSSLKRLITKFPCPVFSQIRHRNALTEIAWKDAGQGLGMTMSTVASEKNMLFIGNVFYN